VDINRQLSQVSDSLIGLFQQVAWFAPICGFPTCGWRPGSVTLTSTHTLNEGSAVALTTSFLQFFERGFLDDEAINMMLHYIRLRVQRHEALAASVVIADLQFTQTLLCEYLQPGPTYSKSSLLKRYEDLFNSLGRKDLYFVLNPGQDHWAVIKVDFVLCTFAYCQSQATK
jgi:hypothetical protein